MRNARLQSNDLGRAETFFNGLLSKEDFKGAEKIEKAEKIVNEVKAPQVVGQIPFKIDPKPRFSDPPAPPPQQPLPEKPDVIRAHPLDLTSPSLKRSSTERPRSVPNVSNVSTQKQEPTSQIISLVEALASAKKEIDAQNSRMRDLEDMLQKEREARETAEGRAKRLELESIGVKMNGFAKTGEGNIVEEAFNPPAEKAVQDPNSITSGDSPSSPEAVEASTAKLQEKLELMMIEMREMREHMESFRQRAETAESERDSDRKTLAEMVAKIRSEEQARRSSSSERARSSSAGKQDASNESLIDSNEGGSSPSLSEQKTGLRNGSTIGESGDVADMDGPLAMALSRPPGSVDHLLYHSTPYASMLGVVLIGMGLMAYMNGWQKVER